jgi:exodeoxyribonuclease V gamma subunit
MKLVRSNRTENLADALASVVRDVPLGPFEKEAIVVQSRGMERWLTLALAERLGVWSNPSFPYPRAVIEQVLEQLSQGRSEEAKAYEPSRLKWTIAELLRESAPADLQTYLGERADDDRTLRLATSVATVFDEYVVYRAPWLKTWATEGGGHWQAKLWRRVAERLGPHDLASRIERSLAELRADSAPEGVQLERLHLFSLETLPPLFLEFFKALSRSVPTVLYVLEPSSEFVSDVDRSLPAAPPFDMPADGHPLLSMLGRLSRDFQQLLLGLDDAVTGTSELYGEPSRETLLGSLQADILAFRSPPEQSARQAIELSDQSISIHACTGPMREVQVLHDLVRAALEDDPTLRPEDVVVMTSDLDTYAPAFRAAFGQDGHRRIPYEVHDRKTRDDAAFYDDFLAVLDVLDSRFSVLDLVRLMDTNTLRQDFRFLPEERARLTELLEAAGIRWGIDAEHRELLEFPAEPLHTWRAGLGRLFLGFASAPDTTDVFDGLLPRGAPSLDDAELVARLARLCEILFDFHDRTRGALSIDAWVSHLERLSASLFAETDEKSPQVRTLHAAFEELRSLASGSGYAGAITLKALRREIGALLVEHTPAVGYLRRGVTLTELVPLRSVPFRVVCLVGMSEESFPRPDVRPSFDLTRPEHRRGDRNKRDEDRHSFLQAVLCARERLIITYSAPTSSLRSGANPSPVVWELCETARRYYALSTKTPVLEPTVHPLHAFDSRYFDGSDLPRSASRRYLEIAQAMAKPSVQTAGVELRADVDSDEEALSVGELTSWLWNPMSAFIDKVLRARFDSSALYEPTSALTELGPLEASKVGNGALRAALRGSDLETYLAAAPEFPDGSWGALERQRVAREIGSIHIRKDALDGGHEAHSELTAVRLPGLVLEGRLDGLGADQRVLKRFTKVGRRAELAVWVEHLLMQVAGFSHATHLVLRGNETRAKLVSFEPVADARGALEDLIDLYRVSRATPPPLLERASWVFAEKQSDGKLDQAITAARSQLKSQRRWDPRLDYVLGPADPFLDHDWSERFQDAASQVYGPLFRHRRET